MDKISVDQIKDTLRDHFEKKNMDVNVVQLTDTLGNQELYRVEIKGVTDLKLQLYIKQTLSAAFHTKITDVRFLTAGTINENLHYDYNGSHMLIYDIEKKYDNIYSGKVQMQIDDEIYGYEILFDDMKGIIEWDQELSDINKAHVADGTSRDFKGLVDMFNIALKGKVNIDRHVKGGSDKKRRKKQKGVPEILINYDQAKGLVSYISINNLDIDNTSFNKMIQELSGQALAVTYEKRDGEMESVKAPKELFIGKSGTYMTDNDMTNITKILSKFGVDTSNYQYVNVKNLSLLPASALIKASIKNDQVKDL